MKPPSIYIAFFLLFLSILSCRNNRLRTNEKDLAKEIQIMEQENTETERIAREKESEMKKSFQGSLRKKEIRSVDPQNPPIRIDILGTQNNIRKFKLSDMASTIRYVKLQTPPDTLLLYDHFFYRPDLESIIRSDGEHIIFQGLFGLTRFNMQGDYQETIWKNETGIRINAGSVFFGGKDFFGVLPHIPVSLLDGNLLYNFQDGPGKKGQIIKYKFNADKNVSVQPQREVPGSSPILGDTVFNTKKHWVEGFTRIVGTGSDTWAGINDKWNAGNSGLLLVAYNDKNDTICQFTDYDRIVDFSHANYRTHAKLTSYYFNELVTIKPEYNDTVFRLIPPNRLLPVYVIDFGLYKVNYMDGLNPDFDLSENYMLYSLHESNNHLFIRFTKNHDGPANRKKKVVKFYNAIFLKKDGKLFHYPEYTLAPEGLKNDLDGGIPFWPEFITPQGEMMKLVSGKIIKDYVNSEEFNKADISQENRRKQISMATGLRLTDMVIVIVK